MILSTMNYEEMYRELVADHEDVRRWISHQRRRVMDVARRCKSYPKNMSLKYMSPRKNQWLINVTIISRNPNRGSMYSECVLRYTDEGWYAHQLMNSRHSGLYQVIVTPHFFKRYAERKGMDMRIEDLMMAWMKNANDAFVDDDQRLSGKKSRDGEHEQWHLCTHDGVMMGEYIKGTRTFIAKTFITYDMTAGRQESVFQANRRELFTNDELKEQYKYFNQ